MIDTTRYKKLGGISTVTIINKVDNDTLQTFGYGQWIEKFLKEVIKQARLECEEIIIDDIEFSKRIYLSIDNREYMIRTWNFHSVERDKNNDVCAEMIDYTLYEMVKDKAGGHGNEICNGMIRIDWKN